MIRDVLTMMWKERRSLPLQGRRRLQLALVLASPLALSIWMPWEAGPDFVRDYMPSLLVTFVFPLLLVGTTIPDFFAGERERKTLEGLLATRLPDRAIVLGKLIVAVAFGWGASILTLLVSLFVVNATHWTGEVTFYSARILLTNLCLGFLVSLVTGSAGVLISLRSRGVQEAQQILIMILLLPPMIAGFVLFAFVDRLRGSIASVDWTTVVSLILVGLALLSMVLVWLALHRFRRGRVALD